MHPRVKAEIERAQRERSSDLNLWHCDLEAVPTEISELSHVDTINLRGNKLRAIPEWIAGLRNLRRLSIARNPLSSIPSLPQVDLHLDWESYRRCSGMISPANVTGIDIITGPDQGRPQEVTEPAQLVPELLKMLRLQSLAIGVESIVYRTPLGTMPPPKGVTTLIRAIGSFQGLSSLRFWGVFLSQLPDGVRVLRRLSHLAVDGAEITELPDWIAELDTLRSVSFMFNRLEQLPATMSHLSNLGTLDLRDNNFAEIPSLVFDSPRLVYVDLGTMELEKGRIREIPSRILSAPRLARLAVDHQPIEVPPAEVVKQGLDAIRNYWRQQEESGVDYLCEAKLLIVGEAGAGKTSLAKKIRDPTYRLASSERSTEGMEIMRWSFPAAIRLQEAGQSSRLVQREFGVNLWDFGGQEIYHATHQFFLTRRSLYALVSDDRKEDTDFRYWLNILGLLSDNSPVLVVQNEKQDRQRDIDMGGLRARFPNLREAYRINLATNRGLTDLVTAIERELEHLPHIGIPLPRSWKLVREALENDERDYITITEYFAICERHGFRRDEDKLQLSGYLHDLGICLHFHDDPILKQTVILKPKWGTDAVYRLLDDKHVIGARGRFERKDLARIWSEKRHVAMRDELLRLMMRFQLCYELPEGDAYIAPQLLSPGQPDYRWNAEGNLVLRYEYDFMPKGVMTRFIVAVNHLIADQSLVWKGGVILEREHTRAEVVEDYPRRQIMVRVAGADPRGLLAIVDDQFVRIHRTFPSLKWDRWLPCHCQVCRQRTDPYAYPLAELKEFAQAGDPIQCRVSRRLVDSTDLIRNAFPGAIQRFMDEAGILAPESPRPPESATKEVFVSYAWTDESRAIVDHLEKTLSLAGVRLLRDRNEVKFKDSITAFMERIGRGRCIVLVLSKHFLESKYCMFELTEIARRGDIQQRVFPIALGDANIFEGTGRLDYVRYWEGKKAELDAKMKAVGSEHLEGIREEMDLFANIRNAMAGIVDLVAGMNTLTSAEHRSSGFRELIGALQRQLEE